MIQKMKCSLIAILLGFGLAACESEAKPNTVSTPQKVSAMNIRFDIEGSNQPVFVTLKNSPTTQDFLKQLPLTLELTDYASSEKIAYLPEKLTSQDAPKGHPAKEGDITYYAPWGNLAVFYKDFDGAASSLIYLGKFDDLPRQFHQKNAFKVTISNVPES